MKRKLFSIGLVCLISLFFVPHFVHAQEKITGPWLWMIAPTEPGQGGAASINIDSLAVASGGAVTESDVAANGAKEGDRIGNYVWTLGEISPTGWNNINECLNRIGLTDEDVDNHSSYALFTFKSDTDQNGVTMHVGSDDAIKVWLNGKVVHNNPIDRGASDFQDVFAINLVAGDNLLMVKVSERLGDWSMFVGIGTVSGDDGQIQDPDIERPIVQVVYRPLPESPPRPNVDAEIDELIKKTQLFFADEMERHGYGRKTFQIEVDTSGNTVVHRGQVSIPRKSIVVYMEEEHIGGVGGACGFGGTSGYKGDKGSASIYCWVWDVIAHELGHAFGLQHDFRGGRHLMSYSGKEDGLSKCAAEWLDTHRVFNPGQSTANEPTKIEMLPPSFVSSPNAIRLRFKVTDPDGLHQAQLLTPTVKLDPLHAITHGKPELLSYKTLNGSTNTTVEFVTNLIPNNKSVSLMVIDVHGNFTWDLQKFPINVPSLLPQAKVVSIPDANLAAAVRRTLRLSSNQAITTHSMLNLLALDAPNSEITDLTGLEHTYKLIYLNLGAQDIQGGGTVNSNRVSDVSALSELTHLTSLELSSNNISDISALAELTQLALLHLEDNNISDISALAEMTQLTLLYLQNNNISDVSALEELKQLTLLHLDNNNISDISALAEMTQLTLLHLEDNNISDISALAELTQLTLLHLDNNNISDISALAEMTQLTLLHLEDNNISDISALAELTQLTLLYLQNNNISDVSALEELKQLTWLRFNNNNISDVSALAELTQLAQLGLNSNNISDVSPLQDMTQLTWLQLYGNNISDVSTLAELTQLTSLGLGSNNISDVSPLQGMTQLETLLLGSNNISDVSALAELKQLKTLNLFNNNISDVSPLLALNLIGTRWDSTGLNLQWNPLNYISINTHIPAMQAKGIEVQYDKRTPTKLLKISGDAQQTVTNTELPLPFVVEVQDDRNRVFSEVPVTFTITKGSGKLSTTSTATDAKGRAKARFTIGEIVGQTTISVTAAKISQPIQFTVTAILPNSLVHLPDTNLSEKIAETLGKPSDASITGAEMLTLTSLTANNAGINDFTGLQYATNLKTLVLDNNNITELQSLTVFKKLETLSLENNKISDVAPLVELTELKTLRLRGNPLSYPSLYTTIPVMRARGMAVVVDPRTPTTLVYIPGNPGVAGTELQVIVQVQDQEGIAFSGVPVTFTLTAAGGHLSKAQAVSNLNGNATTTLTLGPKPGENTVSVTVTEIPKPLNFTITTIDPNTLVHVPDVNLRAKIAESLNKPKNAKLNAADMLKLTGLEAQNANIRNLTGIQYAHNLSYLNLGAVYIEGKGNVNNNKVSDLSPLRGLTALADLNLSYLTLTDISTLAELKQLTVLWLNNNNISDIFALSELEQLISLHLGNNNISDVSPLRGITQMEHLYLDNNNISDVSALAGLKQLTVLWLNNNNISDIFALLVALSLTGTEWNSTVLYLWSNPLSYVSINTHIPAMQAKGIEVQYDKRTPTKLLKISGDAQQTVTNTELPLPFVVEVQDDWNRVFSEVPVTFTITKGSGELSTTHTTTDAKGRAKARFTIGQIAEKTTISVTAAKIAQPVQFIVTVVPLNSPVHLPDTNLSTKIAETLGKPSDEPVTVGDMLNLTSLTVKNAGISNLTGLQHAANLKTLVLDNNNITDVQPLTVFKKLGTVSLENNKISEVAPLVELTELKTLRLRGNPLSYPSLNTHIPAMQAGGVDVTVDPRTPTTLTNIPGPPAVAGATVQVVVQVQDQKDVAFSGVPVTFTLTAAGRHLSKAQAVSNPNGKAFTTLTLGPKSGENTVSVTVNEISQPLNFTITTINPNTLVHVPDVNLRAKITETLNKPKNAKLNATDMLKLSILNAPNANIQNLTGIEYAHNLKRLSLVGVYIEGTGVVNSNAVSDLSPLTGLTKLILLLLDDNSISDVSALSELTQIRDLSLSNNNISDVAPLRDMTQMKYLRLDSNNISDVAPLRDMTQMKYLRLDSNNISDVAPLRGMTQMKYLHLDSNNISDVAPLRGMTQMENLHLDSNNISDVAPLRGMTQMENLHLDSNNISDVAPLRDMTQMKSLSLWDNPLSYTAINNHIPTRQAKGVEIGYQQRVPTKLLKISGDAQQAINNSKLPLPFVVEVQDEWNRTFSEVPVTFTITKGSGELSTTHTTTDAKGRAKVRFTIGQIAEKTTISVTAAKIAQPVQFTVTAIPLNFPVSLPDANLKAKIAETLDKPSDEPVTVGDMLNLTSLTAKNTSISNLIGLQHAANLKTLLLDNNNITDVQSLIVFKKLETLSLENNKISEVAPLVELTELKTLRLRGNPLSYPSLNTHIPAMRAHSIDVTVDPRTPTTLIHIPGTSGVAGAELQVIVQIQDQEGIAFSGVPVTFTLTTTDGHLSKAQAVSNPNGKAITTLTLGPKPGENTVSATVAEISQPLNFTITTIDPNTPVPIPDVNLHAKIVETLKKPKNAKLNATDMLKLTAFIAQNANIQDLTGLEHAHNLRDLYLSGNSISDISLLAGLAKLTWLSLSHNNISDVSPLADLTKLDTLGLNSNSISDVSPLASMTKLDTLGLNGNSISDISPLIGMTKLTRLTLSDNNISDVSPLLALNLIGTEWDSTGLYLQQNPLSYTSINTHIPAMQAKGIEVAYDNVAHPALYRISGNEQENFAGSVLSSPFVVETQDENGEPMEGVSVTFTVETGNGQLTAPTATTDADGRAQTHLMLGWTPGKNTVRATGEGIESWAIFSAVGIKQTTQITEDVNGDGVVDVEDLVLVAATLGTTPPKDAIPQTDVNADGVVNREDMELVLAALEAAPAAPTSVWTAANLQRWIDEAKQLENNAEILQQGIAMLEQLLASMLPKKTALLANYPNPSNPETWIPYHLAKPAQVTLHIYAVNGVLIRTLVLGHQAAGTYQHRNRAAYWDGRNTQGERVASGIYFYTLTAGQFTSTRKMLIRK